MTTLRGRVVCTDGVLADGLVSVAGERVTDLRRADDPDVGDVPPADGVTVLPGLVDVHCHGGGGASFASGDPAQVAAAAAHHLARGTTTLVGSTVTDAPERMLAAVAALADGVDAGHLAAVHVEGPFLAAAHCGAHDPDRLLLPDVGLTRELLVAGRGHVRMMTVAPELPGADAVAALLAEHGATAAVGHTAADAATTARFLERQRPSWVTHLFNGMPPAHHREPGPVLAVLAGARRGSVVELIADGVHVSDDAALAVLDLLGPAVALVTDATAAAGMPDGELDLGPRRVVVRDGVARVRDGGALAGGTSSLLDLVRRMTAAGVDERLAVLAASATPARLLDSGDLGLGRLLPGARADLVVLRDGVVERVMRAGRWVVGPDAA